MYLDKAKVQQSFAAASATYDGVAVLQGAVGKVLLATIDNESPTGTLLDLGCGTGFLTLGLLDSARSIIALDIAVPMLKVTQSKLADKDSVSSVCADAEQLPFVKHSVDGVFSNLALQWCINLEVVFADIKRTLRPGGALIFSTFGPQTLQELKTAWAKVDEHSHVNDFYSEQQLQDFLRQAGFEEIKIETRLYQSSYSSVLALMKELKQIGAHNVIEGRNKKITTKTALQCMIAAYEQHQTGEQITATFEVIMVIAR